MILKIYNGEYSLQWDGIYYLALIDYPNIQEWELEKIAKFIAYEKLHKRQTSIECADSCLKKRNFRLHLSASLSATIYPYR